MTRATIIECRRQMKTARDLIAEGCTERAVIAVLDCMDAIVTTEERTVAAQEQQAKIDEALFSLDQK